MTTQAAIIPMTDEHIGFVCQTWLRSCRKGARFRNLPREVYYTDYQPQVHAILRASETAIAVDVEDRDKWLGWMTIQRIDGDPVVLHMAYTKKDERRSGHFKALAEHHRLNLHRAFFYTHAPPMVGQMARRYRMGVYRPDLLELAV